jgi:hypothetical protein
MLKRLNNSVFVEGEDWQSIFTPSPFRLCIIFSISWSQVGCPISFSPLGGGRKGWINNFIYFGFRLSLRWSLSISIQADARKIQDSQKGCGVLESHWNLSINPITSAVKNRHQYHIISLYGVVTLLGFCRRYGVHYRLCPPVWDLLLALA